MKLTVRQNKNREPIEINRFAVVRREGFEPPAFWSVGCLKGKSEPFRLRFVLFATIRSADFPLFPSSLPVPTPFWVKTGSGTGDSNFAGLALKFFLRDGMAHGIIKVQSQEKL